MNTIDRILVILIPMILTSLYIIWVYTNIEDWLKENATLITLIPVSIAPFWYFYKTSRDKKNSTRLMAKNLICELNDVINILNIEKNNRQSDTSQHTNDKKDGRYYTIMYLNHGIYDSFIHTGKINLISLDEQKKIQNVFGFIKQHNYYLKHIIELEDTLSGNHNDHKSTKYEDYLEYTECRLLELIPIIINELEKLKK